MVPTFKLNNGVEIPAQGLGCFLTNNEREATRSVVDAVAVGYRKIDTAMIYMNEEGIGRGVRECGLPRDQIFLSTKLWNTDHGYDNTLRAFDASLKRLGLDYVDQYLMHWPGFEEESYLPTWKAFETLYKEGRVRSIGVCNFQIHHLQRLIDETGVTPVINQIELHPLMQQRQLHAWNATHKIQTESWSPLAQGGKGVFDQKVIRDLADKYGKTPAQIVIRWHLDSGLVVIPKSVTPSRIAENFDVWDFRLDKDELGEIAKLDQGKRLGPDPDQFGG